MDGFHLADAELRRTGRRDRKGAPDTFDRAGYAALLGRLRREPGTVYAPAFDRAIEDSIAAAVAVPASVPLVVTEGNYLLLWPEIRPLLDEVWYLDPPAAARRAALVARHVAFGKTPAEAERWVAASDDRNAELIAAGRQLADRVLGWPRTELAGSKVGRQRQGRPAPGRPVEGKVIGRDCGLAGGPGGSVSYVELGPHRPFGRLLTAMVTPFTVAGELDLDAARELAAYLVDPQHNDGLVINGTTGEAPTTSDGEKAELLAAVVDAVGDRATVLAGVGTFDTVHSVMLAEQAAKAGADGLLVVMPYYSRPPQAGMLQHFRVVADATALPVMVYDIPGRTGASWHRDDHPARRPPADRGSQGRPGRRVGPTQVLAETDLAYYAGEDAMLLPLLSVGGGRPDRHLDPLLRRRSPSSCWTPTSAVILPRRCGCTGGCCRSTSASSAPRG